MDTGGGKDFWFQYMLPFSCMKHTGLLREDTLEIAEDAN